MLFFLRRLNYQFHRCVFPLLGISILYGEAGPLSSHDINEGIERMSDHVKWRLAVTSISSDLNTSNLKSREKGIVCFSSIGSRDALDSCEPFNSSTGLLRMTSSVVKKILSTKCFSTKNINTEKKCYASLKRYFHTNESVNVLNDVRKIIAR